MTKTDVMTPEQRSRCMSRNKGRNTKPELDLRRALWSLNLRYRLHYKLPGTPDIVFVQDRVAVFVDGCFWHKCPTHGTSPKTNAAFWRKKIQGNVDRDKRVSSELEDLGWTVLRFWEHQIENELETVVEQVFQSLNRLPPKRASRRVIAQQRVSNSFPAIL